MTGLARSAGARWLSCLGRVRYGDVVALHMLNQSVWAHISPIGLSSLAAGANPLEKRVLHRADHRHLVLSRFRATRYEVVSTLVDVSIVVCIIALIIWIQNGTAFSTAPRSMPHDEN